MTLGRVETAERRSRDRGSDVIANLFRSRTELRLKNEDKNFEFKAVCEAFLALPQSLLWPFAGPSSRRGGRFRSFIHTFCAFL